MRVSTKTAPKKLSEIALADATAVSKRSGHLLAVCATAELRRIAATAHSRRLALTGLSAGIPRFEKARRKEPSSRMKSESARAASRRCTVSIGPRELAPKTPESREKQHFISIQVRGFGWIQIDASQFIRRWLIYPPTGTMRHVDRQKTKRH